MSFRIKAARCAGAVFLGAISVSTHAQAPPRLSTFSSDAEFEQLVLDAAVGHWEHSFGQQVCRTQSGFFQWGLPAGDANQDGRVDQIDLVQVQIAAKYLSGAPANWGDGDWNEGPGGCPGDGLFNQPDIIAALRAGLYLTGHYADGGSGGFSVPDYSDTNVQVPDVDEGDIVETDGNHIYYLTGRQLVVAEAWPPNRLGVTSRVSLRGQPFAEYLRDDRLTILSQDINKFGPQAELRPAVRATVMDISDPSAPRLVHETSLEGTYVDSRAVGDNVLIVSRDDFGPDRLRPEVYCDSPDDVPCVVESVDQYRQRLAGQVLDRALPNFVSTGSDGTSQREGLISSATSVYRPQSPGQSSLLSLVSLDVMSNRPGLVSTSSVMTNDTTEVYASADSVYVLNPDWESRRAGFRSDSTSVLRFDNDQGEVDLAAVGQVPGRVLNSFSVDERDGHLRVATSARWGTDNRVYVLNEVGDELRVVGQTENMAPGEQIRSVRYVDDTGYVVTFRNTDPLFTVDLSDPADPSVLGELKITGFSNYLHPIGEDYLIGLGRDADELTGRARQLQISLFDVTDLSRPELAERFDFDLPTWAQTEAIGDHHALAYYPESRLLAIPVTGDEQVWVDRDGDGTDDIRVLQPKTDLWVIQIDPEAAADGNEMTSAIELLGRIEHDTAVRRSLRIEDLLYSLSEHSIEVHQLFFPDVQLADLRFGPLGDVNGDRRFDQVDIIGVLDAGRYLTGSPATPSEGDWNLDGVFDQLDVAAVLQQGQYAASGNAPLSVVPEPSSVALLCAGLLLVRVVLPFRRATVAVIGGE